MIAKLTLIGALSGVAILALTGCTTRTPTVAHVHIGHAMTGWHDTPDKAGLFVSAEQFAGEALKYSQNAAGGKQDLGQIKTDIGHVIRLSDTESPGGGHTQVQGVKQALAGAVSHITYAATSPDASGNVKSFAGGFSAHAAGVLDRCDLITALGNDIRGSDSLEEARLLAPEIEKLARANIHGEDLNADGQIGSSPAEYGLVQLRRDIEAMIAREDPPYTTVSSWYLFNLIRLPDGSWIFRKKTVGSSSNGSSGGNEGGY